MEIRVEAPDDDQREAAARLKKRDKTQEGEYEQWESRLEHAADALEKLCKTAYEAREAPVLRCYARVKKWDKLLPKLQDGRAERWDKCTDLLAMRLVVLKTSEIDDAHSAVADLVKEDSEVDQTWFAPGASAKGYQARHMQLDIPANWEVPDNTTQVGAELQIVTALQESWAALSHDDFYKPSKGVPLKLEKRVLRLAAVMNLVDDEMVTVSEELEPEVRKVHERIGKVRNRRAEQTIELDAANLYAVAGTRLKVAFIDLRQLGRDAGFRKSGYPELVRPGFETDVFLELARELDIKTMAQLRDSCEGALQKKPKLAELAKKVKHVPPGRGTLFDRPLTVLSAALLFDYAPRVKSPFTEDITRVLYGLLD